MYIIGEKINGMFKNVADAIKTKDTKIIKDIVEQQISAGCNALDVNVGLSAEDAISAMSWLVSTIREYTDIPLAIDTTKISVMEKGLQVAGNQGNIINSANASEKSLHDLFELAKKFNAKVICLTSDESGIVQDSNKRVENAAKILDMAAKFAIETSDIFIDPVLLPLNYAQQDIKNVLTALQQIKYLAEPPPKTIVGLSNISSKIKDRSLINRTFLVMAIASGLDAAILDPTDTETLKALITAEVLIGNKIYCENFLSSIK